MKTSTSILDNQLVAILDKYDSVNLPGTNLRDRSALLQDAPKVIPVIGMQGVGKSTLIDALLGEFILPAEADETTCIPVEVKYGEPRAEVFRMGDAKPFTTVNDQDGLRQYVDNNFNHGNEKKIAKIVLYRKCKLLETGLSIVDLPGVGSLTQANQQTTEDYLKNCCAAIIVIHTIPTITKTEAIFIKSHLMFFGSSIFVQNNWGETEQELQSSTEFNRDVIDRISKEANYTGDKSITVVDADSALRGACQKDSGMVQSSNIHALISKIEAYINSWDDINGSNIIAGVGLAIEKAIKTIDAKIGEINMSQQEARAQKQKAINEFNAATGSIKQTIKDTKKYLNTKDIEYRQLVKEKIDTFTKQMQAEMEKKINGGVVDGDDIERAFRDHQESRYPDLCNDILPHLFEVKSKIENTLEDVGDIMYDDSDTNRNVIDGNPGTEDPGQKGRRAWNVAAGIAGFAGGTAFASTAAAASISAALGVATAGIGFIVGIGISLIIGAFGAWRVKKKMEGIKSKIINDMRKLYPQINSSLLSDFNNRFNDFRDNAYKCFDAILDNRQKEVDSMTEHLDDAPTSIADKESLESDKNYLQTKLNELNK